MAQPHAVLLNNILLEIQRAQPNVRAFKRVVGKFRHISQPEIVVSVGVEGACDIFGYLPGTPAVPFEIEVKVAGDKASPAQLNYHRMLGILGVPLLVAHAKYPTDFATTAQQAAAWVASLTAVSNVRSGSPG